MMSLDEPPYLCVGTEVSAKYRGAFCEAKIKHVEKNVKVKVHVKETNTNHVVSDEDIKGPLKVGLPIAVKLADAGNYTEAVILKITDSSTYRVVFDDGDENTLRRTQVNLKGDKHFVQSETLDELPLTHPEHFGTPVVQNKKHRRKPAGTGVGSDSEDDDTSSEDSRRRTYRGRLPDLVGQVVCVEVEERKKTYWVPVLIVDPNADPLELKSREHLLVRSFKDSKFHAVSKRDAKEFTPDLATKNEDKTLKIAYERAVTFVEKKELPPSWDKSELLGSESDSCSESEHQIHLSEHDDFSTYDAYQHHGQSSDDEPSEEKDLFVAQLYKFMDDRGTPINKAPVVGNRDLNLYRLFRVVQNIGGYNKVTNQNKWKFVYDKMNLPQTTNAATQIKNAYKKFLHAFEDFYRKLGSTMGTISRPSRSRHSSGRSLLSFRDRESPKSPRTERKTKDDIIKEEKKEEPSKKKDENEKVEKSEMMPEFTADPSSSVRKAIDASLPDDKDKPFTKVLEKVVKKIPEKEKPKLPEKEKQKPSSAEKLKAAKPPEKEKISKPPEKDKPKAVDKEKPLKVETTVEPPSEIPKKTRTRLKEDKAMKDEKITAVNRELIKSNEKVKEEVTLRTRDTRPASIEIELRNIKRETEPRSSRRDAEEAKEGSSKRMQNKDTIDVGAAREAATNTMPDDTTKAKVKAIKKKIVPKLDDRKEGKTENEDDSGEKTEESDTDSVKEKKRRTVAEVTYSVGSKLKVRYGKGKNQKLYEAKVMEAQPENGVMHYLVHYAGWNNRYDEWVKKERIVSVIEEGPGRPGTDSSTKKQHPTKGKMPLLKSVTKPPAAPSGATIKSKSDAEAGKKRTPREPRNSAPPGRPANASPEAKEVKAKAGEKAGKGSRLTRSNSTDVSLTAGLTKKPRMTRRTSGYTESSDKSSHMSDSEHEEESEQEDGEPQHELQDSQLEAAEILKLVQQEPQQEERKPALQALADMTKDISPERPVLLRASHPDQQKASQTVESKVVPKTENKPPGDGDKKGSNRVLQVEISSPSKSPSRLPQPALPLTLETKQMEVKPVEVKQETLKVESITCSPPRPEPVVPPPVESMVKTPQKEDEKVLPEVKVKASVYDFTEEQVEVEALPVRLLPKPSPERALSGHESVIPSTTSEATGPNEESKSDKAKPKRTKKEASKCKAARSTVVPSDEINTPQEKISLSGNDDDLCSKSEVTADKDTSFTDAKEKKTAKAEKKKGKLEKEAEKKPKKGPTKLKVKAEHEETSSAPEIDTHREGQEEPEKEAPVKKKVKKKRKRPLEAVDDHADSSGAEEDVSKPKKAKQIPQVPNPPESHSSHAQVPHQAHESGTSPLSCESSHQAHHDAAQALLQMPTSAFNMAATLPLHNQGSHSHSHTHTANETTVFSNTPPDTPEGSPARDHIADSPSQDDLFSIRSDRDGNIEVEVLTDPAASSTGGESPNGCYGSIESNASGSDQPAPSTSESSSDAISAKRRMPPEETSQPKRRKRGHRRSGTGPKSKATIGSDSDDTSTADSAHQSHHGSPAKRLAGGQATTSTDPPRSPRPSKYNFLDLEEGKYLEGEARIGFLQDKIMDLRKIYMQLKAEVACIDRRRKRARRREREAAQAMAQATVLASMADAT